MATRADWVKNNHLEFNQQIKQSTTYLLVQENMTRMGFKTGSEQEAWVKKIFSPKVSSYLSAFNNWYDEATRTRTATYDLYQEEKELKVLYRQLYTGFLKSSPLVTNEDLFRMNMPTRFSGPKSPAPVAGTHPASRADGSEIRVLRIHFGSEIQKSVGVKKGKPAGQQAAMMCWGVRDSPATSIKDLPHVKLDTNSPFVLTFTDDERGKAFCYSLCWSNTRGEQGPFGPILMAIVP
ncbi:MAG: hypothetical protein LBD64_04975 [Odoribacteraceae bacterium]|jgi:hypothetical protein|nr:hypothetical protein [Odoribacteraceae bacterium]